MIIPLTAAFTLSTAPAATAVGAAPPASLAVVQPFDPGFDDPGFDDPGFRDPFFRHPVFRPPFFRHPVFRPPFFRRPVFRPPFVRHPVFPRRPFFGDPPFED